MSYTVFKNNNKSITAPNESGEIVLDTSISRQIRIAVDRDTYRFYDIAEKKYLKLSEIKAINPEKCFFTAIIYPCGTEIDYALVTNESNYPIVYKFVDSCLGSTLSISHISDYFGKYCSNNIYFTNNFNLNPITIEFEFQRGVKIGLNLFPSGLDEDTTFDLASNDVEIISLFQHNISINASRTTVMSSSTKYIFSLSFSLINNRYEQYDKSGLSAKERMSSMLNDLPPGKNYPASGLIYYGRYTNGASTMSISVYTIKYIYTTNNTGLTVYALLTDKGSASTSSTAIDTIAPVITPSLTDTLTFTDDVTPLS